MTDNPTPHDTRIGVLVDVTGDHFTARLDGADDAGPGTTGQVGAYLRIANAAGHTLVMVERSYRVADKQGRAVNMAQLTPLGELAADG